MDTINSSILANAPASEATSGEASTEAPMRPSQIWFAGCKKLGEIMAETATGHFSQTAEAWQAMSRVKSLKDAVEMQTNYFRSATEHSVAGAKKLVEATNHITHEMITTNFERVATLAPASVSTD